MSKHTKNRKMLIVRVQPYADPFAAEAEEAARRVAEDAERRRVALVGFLDAFPYVLRSACMNDLDADLRTRLETWAATERPGFVLLYGPPGTGKTYAAYALARHLAETRPAAPLPVLVNVPRWIEQHRAACRAGAGDADPAAEDVAAWSSPLVLDDIGLGKSTDFVLEKLYVVIDGRYGEQLPTLITCNLGLPDLAARYDDRLASRLGSGLVLRMTGLDRRLQRG